MSRPHITLSQIRERAAPKTYARGESIYLNKDISETALRGNVIEGMCEAGSQPDPYQVQATITGEGIIDTACTCLYDFGGDCKHVVALLLTYLNSPNSFEERVPLADVLESRDKSELIALIRQMVKRYPDLKSLIERPIPHEVTSETPLDTKSYRKELRQALRKQREWGRPGAELTVKSLCGAAEEFSGQGDWRSASSIYRMIIEECLANTNYFYEDEEGWYAASIDDVFKELGTGLDYLVDDDGERKAILDSLMDFYLENIDAGGDVGADIPDIVLRYTRVDDIANLRRRVKNAIEKIAQDSYSDWTVEAYTEFLMQLDLLDNVDPETILTRLRDEKRYDLLIGKLLELKRVDEAVAIIQKHMKQPHERIEQLPRLYAAGYPEDAIQLAEELLNKAYDQSLADLLIDMLEIRGDTEASFQWQLKRMTAEPSIDHFDGLKRTSLKLGNWALVCPAIMEQLEKFKQYAVLTRAYLSTEEWDKAWATLPKAIATRNSQFGGDYRLEMDVAERTLQTHPEKALPVFIDAARKAIDRRSRDSYQQAAGYLVTVRDTYDSIDEYEVWEKVIARIRSDFPRLPALHDELRKAGL